MAWSVSCCLSHPLCDDLVVQEWLKKHDVSALLINITNKIIDNNELSDNMTILKQCFMHNEGIFSLSIIVCIYFFTSILFHALHYSFMI